MTKKEKIDLLNELVELEERNDIGSLLRSERREFQYWVNEIIDAVPVAHGEWYEYDDDYGMFCCSVCEGMAPDGIRWDYCPHCGAKMVEGD